MGDGDAKPFSIARCRELLGAEDNSLSEENPEDQCGRPPERPGAAPQFGTVEAAR